jgi:hypothetical protein
VLIQSGTLRVGDAIVAGTAYGRVRAMVDENGDAVAEAAPSRPVQVQGLNSVPRAGDTFIVTEEDRTARQIAEKREAAERNAQLAKARKRISLEDFTRALEEGKVESLNLIIKGDVSGAVEALEESLLKIDVDDSVQLRIIHRGVGAVTESDVNLATIDNAIVIGFNVRPDRNAADVAEREEAEREATRGTVSVHGKDRSWHHAVKRGSVGVGSSQGGLAPRGSRLSRQGRRGRRSAPSGELHARQSGDGTGARVERRLQKLARGIFLVPPRSPRGGRGGAVVARHGGQPGRGRSSGSGERVRSAPRRVPSTGNSRALTRPQGRESSQRKALWSLAWLQP